MKCPACETENADTNKFCYQCGQELEKLTEATKPSLEGERKHVTILFSDLSGYTTLSEKLDPEEVKEIMSRIFREASQVIAKYEGVVEKFIGDAIMAIFGVPIAHEDDPIRAIKAAREIHALVERIGQEVKDRIGKQLLMHSGISTGLVITGEGDIGEGAERATGDTINLASRLTDLAKPGEVLVGENTYKQAEHYFAFEKREPTYVKGKEEPVELFKVLSEKKRPSTIHRLTGLRSKLIGREEEMAKLKGAVEQLGKGKGSIISIVGEPGTGKSRLTAEFQTALNLNNIQWLEGRSHAYAKNIPHHLFIDLIRRTWQIEEKDSPEEAKEKIETNVKSLQGIKDDIIPYIGNLLGLRYKETEYADPQSWKGFLFKSVKTLFSSFTHKSPTIICLEDLHWADSSSVELLQFILFDTDYPALFLCVYRPEFTLFSSRVSETTRIPYQEIHLKDLSQNQAQDMLKSLLKADTIPEDLSNFVRDKVEGNPFYLEEVINSLIEADTLVRDNGDWRLTRQLTETEVPLTLTGVIAARIDRLEKDMKRILQEASVVGRVFLYEILKRITEIKDHLEGYLDDLEITDLIRKRSIEPELEYIFKHALTQDVVYNGLLKRERQEIHEHIGQVIEVLFQERLPEFYETLAFHFKQGKSFYKAVDYLMKSGEKSLNRYALEESDQYFKEAFDFLTTKRNRSKEEEGLLIDLVDKWAWVFYYRGDFKGLKDLVEAHEDLAKLLNDKAGLARLYMWLGFAMFCGERFRDSYQYLHDALKLGEETENQQIICYACSWLSWTCAELGLLDEAITVGEKSLQIAKLFPSDQYFHFKSLAGLAWSYWMRGDKKKVFEKAKALLDYGKRTSNIRGLVWGHWAKGLCYFMDGNFQSAIECSKEAGQIAQDPLYSYFPRALLGALYVNNGQFQEAEAVLREVIPYGEKFGMEQLATLANIYLGVALIGRGYMGQGLKMIEEAQGLCLKNERKVIYALSEYILGKVYLQITQRAAPLTFSTITRNIGFLIKNVPFASKKAKYHFDKATEAAREIGAKGVLGRAYLDLGVLYKLKDNMDQARKCISKSIELFEQCEVEEQLKEAKEVLASLV